jgi:DNA excision repair protein ERCC-2
MGTTGATIEEFKTASLIPGKNLSQLPGFERHRRQLMLYCDLWTRLGNSVAAAQIVYVDPDSGREEIVGVEFDARHQAGRTESRLRQLLNEWNAKDQSRRRKSIFADGLPFPHAAPRAGQQRLISAICDSLETGGHLLAEAATGSGKTAAALYPALKYALRTGRQLVFLTSKTTQQALAVKVLETMNRENVFRVVQLRAKEKMCANDRVFCHEDVCRFARNYPTKMERSQLLDRLLATLNPTPDDVFEAAKAEVVCPFEVELELARHADVIVADYNYVFNPGSALMHLRDDGLREAILVIDEAHNLPDRIRDIFSPELSEQDVTTALDLAEKHQQMIDNVEAPGQQLAFSMANKELSGELQQVLAQALQLLQRCGKVLGGDKDGAAEIALPQADFLALWEKWQPAFFGYIHWKQNQKVFLETDPIADFHFALLRFITVLRFIPAGQNISKLSGFAPIAERRGEHLHLAILCLDPAIPAASIFRQASSAVFLSATLQPFELFGRMLGLEKSRISSLAVPSPFPRENRRILILPQVRTTYTEREKHLPKIAELIAEIDQAHDGNKLILFPSYDFLRKILFHLSPAQSAMVNGGIPWAGRLQIQSANATDKERRLLLKTLSKPPAGGILLLAVLGGVFAEGVDYPGELLETVVVVSPGLPQLSFERELLRRHFDESGGNGFEYAYLQPGMTRVIQAAGRLIRTETDRGVIALICGRFLEDAYAERLPRDWYDVSPLELISEKPGDDIKSFFTCAETFKN